MRTRYRLSCNIPCGDLWTSYRLVAEFGPSWLVKMVCYLVSWPYGVNWKGLGQLLHTPHVDQSDRNFNVTITVIFIVATCICCRRRQQVRYIANITRTNRLNCIICEKKQLRIVDAQPERRDSAEGRRRIIRCCHPLRSGLRQWQTGMRSWRRESTVINCR